MKNKSIYFYGRGDRYVGSGVGLGSGLLAAICSVAHLATC